MSDSYIGTRAGTAVSFVGSDATRYYQAIALRVALLSYADHKILVNPKVKPAKLLALASRITGKTYPRGAYLRAAADVGLWASEMRAALPIIELKPESES